ncbi:HNH endonuclease [Catenulispora rubra]|uniref:HNH endonuclease n=1 Tax=Catenulispora rubra TaxID=280293 RepID=UPI001891F4F5|nr:HNH endonuclease signature motif containing protein [Catenulispora rubra]
MTVRRPDVPRQLYRDLLPEAGHRCPIPACGAVVVEVAHIIPWRQVRRHDFANMIALCPTCHARFDRGDIDRASMRAYKSALTGPGADRFRLVDAYRGLQTALDAWVSSINAYVIWDLTDDSHEANDTLLAECSELADRSWNAAEALGRAASADTADAGESVCSSVQAWADDVIAGRWPDSSSAPDEHPDPLRGLDPLHRAVCGDVSLRPDVLPMSLDEWSL